MHEDLGPSLARLVAGWVGCSAAASFCCCQSERVCNLHIPAHARCMHGARHGDEDESENEDEDVDEDADADADADGSARSGGCDWRGGSWECRRGAKSESDIKKMLDRAAASSPMRR